MIHISKIADVVLLHIAGNFGFEMETMEVLNVIAMHGLPFNMKKPLQYRLWSELYQGPKLLYVFGVLNGGYPDREIHNLSRFISVMKTPRPLVWRDSHYYRLADRLVDLAEPVARVDGAKVDRKVEWDRYVRGLSFPIEAGGLHIPSVGDWAVSCVKWLRDPCPSLGRAAVDRIGRKWLGDKQKLIYARMRAGSRLVAENSVFVDGSSHNVVEVVGPQGVGWRLVDGLQKDLHFGSQIHQRKPKTNATYLVSRTVAVSSDERKGRDMMHPIAARQKEKEDKRRECKDKKREMYKKKVAENMEMKATRVKRERGQRRSSGGDLTGRRGRCLMPVVGVGSV
ncbi:hypothetical protein HOY80DRAFT_1137567 [Tuber brumale]|nr:hypothetical protein HOY80DRAFT_1137567 [Tuber brumale]